MKINKQEEYGLRILLRIARADREVGLSIPQLSDLEDMSQPYVAKVTRALRMAEFIESTRGQKGGYILSKEPNAIIIKEVINAMGGELFTEDFCGDHTGGVMKLCTNSVDCSIRSLWKLLQYTVDNVLANITLADLIGNELQTRSALEEVFENIFVSWTFVHWVNVFWRELLFGLSQDELPYLMEWNLRTIQRVEKGESRSRRWNINKVIQF